MKRKAFTLQVFYLFTLSVFVSCSSTDSQEKGTETVQEQPTLTPEERLQKVKTELKAAKADLTKEGEYDCCIHPTCDWCALHEGECECHDNLKADKEVCPGCGLGWHNGKGVVEGVTAGQVEWNITHEHADDDGHKH